MTSTRSIIDASGVTRSIPKRHLTKAVSNIRRAQTSTSLYLQELSPLSYSIIDNEFAVGVNEAERSDYIGTKNSF